MNCPAKSIATIGSDSSTAAPFSAASPLNSRQLGTVLVVDDSRSNRIILQRQLQSIGCQVQQAENGREALSQMGEQCFDLVLMDCQMPKMDGYEATRQLRRIEGDRCRTKIIALTANTQPGHKEMCLASGMDGYLNKPISKSTLLQVVQQLLFTSATPTGDRAG
ncbi:MAG: response regulator [Cyanobacteria bacterium J06597_1]